MTNGFTTLSAFGRLASALCLAMTLTVAQPPHLASPAYAQGPASVADLAEKLLPSVVNISTSQNVGGTERNVPRPQAPEGSPFQDFFDEFFKDGPGNNNRGRRVQSLGSGFVIDTTGFIVTNNHVIADADDIEVIFSDGAKLPAKLIGTDTKTDLALLKIEPGARTLVPVPWGDSDKSRVGDWVMAIGNPFGFGGSVTLGIISARGRDINSGPYDNYIQTDAAINRGNSGGPLFNVDGEVIGINTAIISPTGGSIGIGFAIPSELARGVIAQLGEFGETRRGWLGVRIQPVTDDIAESLGMANPEGALVAGIIEGGPVAGGEIQPGDVIVSFDGKPIVEMRDLPRIVAESPVGKAVDVEVMRKGVRMTVKVTLGRLEDGEKLASATAGEDQKAEQPAAVQVLGMTLGDLDDAAREKFGIAPEVNGVLIAEVAEGSPAAEREIEPGMVIAEVGQETVKNAADVADRIEKLKQGGRRNALLMLAATTGEFRFVTVRIE